VDVGPTRQDDLIDAATEQRWREREPPFDGLTVYTSLLPTTVLLHAAHTLVGVVEGITACRELLTYEDWHEHDGYNKSGQEASWHDLRAALSSEERLRESSPGDDLVRRAWLPVDCSFYLRWLWYPEEPARHRVPESRDPSEGGDIDLTAGEATISNAAGALMELGIEPLVVPAGEFFRSRWAG
jgi:hypothetical protein